MADENETCAWSVPVTMLKNRCKIMGEQMPYIHKIVEIGGNLPIFQNEQQEDYRLSTILEIHHN